MVARFRTLAAFLLLVSAAEPAAAGGDLFKAVDDWLVRLEDRDTAFVECFETLSDQRVRFQQITDDDPTVSDPVRNALNQIVTEAIPRSWLTRESLVVAEEIRQTRPGEGASAQDQLRDLAASPVTVRATAARNHIDVARLLVTVVLRNAEGTVCVSRTRQFHFSIASLSLADEPGFSARQVDIFDFDATLRDGLRRTPPQDLPPSATIPFLVISDFSGERCLLARRTLEQEMTRAAVDVADPIGAILGDGRRGYVLIDEEEAQTTPHLRLVATRSIRAPEDIADRVAVLEFVWRDGRRGSPGLARIVALPSGTLGDCTGQREANPLDTFLANAESRRRYWADISAAVDPFTLGDPLELDFSVGEPLHPYCWFLAEEGAVILYPYRPGQARRQFVAGTYRFPEDFALPAIPLSSDEGASLFHCFVSPRPVPEPVIDRWLAAQARGVVLGWPEADALSLGFRENAAVSEVWAPIRAVGQEAAQREGER